MKESVIVSRMCLEDVPVVRPGRSPRLPGWLGCKGYENRYASSLHKSSFRLPSFIFPETASAFPLLLNGHHAGAQVHRCHMVSSEAETILCQVLNVFTVAAASAASHSLSLSRSYLQTYAWISTKRRRSTPRLVQASACGSTL